MKDELLQIFGFLYGGGGVLAYMVFPLRLHLGGRSLQIGLRFNLSKHLHPRISRICRIEAWAHKVDLAGGCACQVNVFESSNFVLVG